MEEKGKVEKKYGKKSRKVRKEFKKEMTDVDRKRVKKKGRKMRQSLTKGEKQRAKIVRSMRRKQD